MINCNQCPRWLYLLESGGVLVALPFLMFPTTLPILSQAALLAVILVWVVSAVASRRPWPHTPYNGAVLLLSAMVAVGVAITAFPDVTVPKAANYILGVCVWRYLSIVVVDQTRLKWAVLGFVILGLGMLGIGIIATDWPVKIPLLEQILTLLPERLLQLPETFSTRHANQLGGTILIYFPLVISFFINVWFSRQHWLKVFGAVFAVILVTGMLLLTQSRSSWIGGWIGGNATLLLWAWLLPNHRAKAVLRSIVVIVLLATIAVAVWMGPEQLNRIMQEPSGITAFGRVDTFGFRQEVWKGAVNAIRDFPFTGCGLGTFRRVMPLLYPINVSLPDISHAHNIFLQVALDVGVPGLIAYVALLGLMIRGAWKAARNASYRVLAVGILGGTLALHVYGLLDALALGSKTAIAFWYSLGLLSAMTSLSSQNEEAMIVSGIEHKV